jgi:Flp pilus assembly pilin Flp
MTSLLLTFLREDDAQDLVEYTLLMAFVLFTVAGLVLGIGDSVHTVTSISTSQINAAGAQIH